MKKPLVTSTALLAMTAATVGFVNRVDAARPDDRFISPLESEKKSTWVLPKPKHTLPFHNSPEICHFILQGIGPHKRSRKKMAPGHFWRWLECRFDLK